MNGAQKERWNADSGWLATRTLEIAQAFLSRWRDCATRLIADDAAQETAIEVWRCRDTLRHRDRLRQFVRTVSRRQRYRAVLQHLNEPVESLDADEDLCELLIDEPPVVAQVAVGARRLPLPWCLAELDDVLLHLGALNRRVLLGYYEGFSCAELAERYDLSVASVKARLHRNRGRIRLELEGRVQAATECADRESA